MTAPKKNVEVELSQLSIIRVERFSFEAKVALRISWREPHLDHILVNNETNLMNFWNPQIEICNNFGEVTTESRMEADLNANNEMYITEIKYFHGLFKTTQSVSTYPFDVYKLRFILNSKLDDPDITFSFQSQAYLDPFSQISQDPLSPINPGEFILNEMYLCKSIDEEFSLVFSNRQGIIMTVMVRRRIIPFVGKFVRLFFLYLISLLTLTMNPRIYKDGRVRTSTVVFMLSTLTCQMTKESNVHAVTTETLYFLVILYNELSIILYHCVVDKLCTFVSIRNNALESADVWFSFISLGLMGLFHMVLILHVYVKQKKAWGSFFVEMKHNAQRVKGK